MVMRFPDAVPGGVVGVLTHAIVERVLELFGFELTPTGRGEYRGATGEALPAARAGDRGGMVGMLRASRDRRGGYHMVFVLPVRGLRRGRCVMFVMPGGGRTIGAMLVAHAKVFVAGRESSLVPAHPFRSVLSVFDDLNGSMQLAPGRAALTQRGHLTAHRGSWMNARRPADL